MPILQRYFLHQAAQKVHNTAINASVRDLGCRHIITSAIEHHATLHTVEHLHHTWRSGAELCKGVARWPYRYGRPGAAAG